MSANSIILYILSKQSSGIKFSYSTPNTIFKGLVNIYIVYNVINVLDMCNVVLYLC